MVGFVRSGGLSPGCPTPPACESFFADRTLVQNREPFKLICDLLHVHEAPGTFSSRSGGARFAVVSISASFVSPADIPPGDLDDRLLTFHRSADMKLPGDRFCGGLDDLLLNLVSASWTGPLCNGLTDGYYNFISNPLSALW